MKCAAAIALLLAVQLAGAPPPKLVREIGLSHIIPGHPEFTSVSLTFSPDENWIAMVGGYHFAPGRGQLRVPPPGSSFLVPRNGPVNQVMQIDPRMYVSEGALWSPNSDSILVEGFTGGVLGPNTGRMAKLSNLRARNSGTSKWAR